MKILGETLPVSLTNCRWLPRRSFNELNTHVPTHKAQEKVTLTTRLIMTSATGVLSLDQKGGGEGLVYSLIEAI